MTRWQSRQMKCRPLGDLLTRADPQLGQSNDAITPWRVDRNSGRPYRELYFLGLLIHDLRPSCQEAMHSYKQTYHNAGLGNLRRGLRFSAASRPSRKSKSQPWWACKI